MGGKYPTQDKGLQAQKQGLFSGLFCGERGQETGRRGLPIASPYLSVVPGLNHVSHLLSAVNLRPYLVQYPSVSSGPQMHPLLVFSEHNGKLWSHLGFKTPVHQGSLLP